MRIPEKSCGTRQRRGWLRKQSGSRGDKVKALHGEADVAEWIMGKARAYRDLPRLCAFFTNLSGSEFKPFDEFTHLFEARQDLGGDRSSVPYETYVLRLLEAVLVKTGKPWAITPQYKLSLSLASRGQLNLRFDFAIQVHDALHLVEVKKNLDNADRDLAKFLLLHELRTQGRFKTYAVVMQEWPGGGYPISRTGNAALLDWGAEKLCLRGWSYQFPCMTARDYQAKRWNAKQVFHDEVGGLSRFLGSAR